MTRIAAARPILVAAALAGGLAPQLAAQGRRVTPADQAAGEAWWAHIKVLADEGMEGRLTGSDAYLRAARYVVSQFDSAGLQPAGVNGFYQPVKFSVTRVHAEKSSVSLCTNGQQIPLALGLDAILSSRGTQPKSITAPLVSWDTVCICPKRTTTISTLRNCPHLPSTARSS